MGDTSCKVQSHPIKITDERLEDDGMHCGYGIDAADLEHQTMADLLIEADWFWERVFGYLSVYDLLDCSLVNHCFCRVARRFMNIYKIKNIDALPHLSEEVAGVQSLTVYPGLIKSNVVHFEEFGLFNHLTSLVFNGQESSFGFSQANTTELFYIHEIKSLFERPDIGQRHLTGIGLLTNLRTLKVCKDYIVNLQELCTLTNLTSLELNKGRYATAQLPYLATLTQLETLMISYPTGLPKDNFYSVLGKLVGLRHLSVRYLWSTDDYFTNVVLKMQRLESLVLYLDDHSSASSLNTLSELPNLQSLGLFFDGCVKQMDSFSIAKLHSLKKLLVCAKTTHALKMLQWVIDVHNTSVLSFPLCQTLRVGGRSFIRPEFKTLKDLEITAGTLKRMQFTGNDLYLTKLTCIDILRKDRSLMRSALYKSLISLKVVLTDYIDFESLKYLQNLRQLSVCVHGTYNRETINGLHCLTNLQKLICLEFDATAKSVFFESIPDFFHTPTVEELLLISISNTETINRTFFLVLMQMKGLRWLTISGNLLNKDQELILKTALPMLRRISRIETTTPN